MRAHTHTSHNDVFRLSMINLFRVIVTAILIQYAASKKHPIQFHHNGLDAYVKCQVRLPATASDISAQLQAAGMEFRFNVGHLFDYQGRNLTTTYKVRKLEAGVGCV